MNHEADIIIVGSGITGCAVAMELSKFDASVLVLDMGCDIAEGATKANSGIVHAGYDAMPGSKKAYYNVRGAAMFPQICHQLNIPYKKCGAIVAAFDESERSVIESLKSRGILNGVQHLSIIERDAVLKMEPNINPQVVCALNVPDSAIVSPYEAAFAMADFAALNGVTFMFNFSVHKVERNDDKGFVLSTENESFYCKALINCAGSGGADIHNQLTEQQLHMIHRRGQYYLLDRSVSQPFSRTIFQCPSSMGKGVLISPTVHGNLLMGPTAEDINEPLDTATTAQGLSEILAKAVRTWPSLSVRQNITNFSGIRAHLESNDFIVGQNPEVPGFFEAVGIESPGLSSAPAIGQDLSAQVAEYLSLKRKTDTVSYKAPNKSFHDMSVGEKASAVESDSAYGHIVCRCEMVTEAEIRAAINRPVGARTIDGVKRRTRAGMGRCQGGFCLPRVADIISEETGIPLEQVTKDGGNSYLLSGTVESFLKGESIHDQTVC